METEERAFRLRACARPPGAVGPELSSSGSERPEPGEVTWEHTPSRHSRSACVSPSDSPAYSQRSLPDFRPVASTSSPSPMRLASCTAAFATHTPHTVLLISSPSYRCGDSTATLASSSRRASSFSASSPGCTPSAPPSRRARSPRGGSVFSGHATPPALLLTCCGSSILISPVGIEHGCAAPSFSSSRTGSGHRWSEGGRRSLLEAFSPGCLTPSSFAPNPQMTASNSPAMTSFSLPRVYTVHTALVTTLSFSASLNLVCSTQRPTPHLPHFASLWCPYTVQERARLPLHFAGRADVVSAAFLPDPQGLLLLVKDGKYSIFGYMNLRAKLSRNASVFTIPHTSPRSTRRRFSSPCCSSQPCSLAFTAERFPASPRPGVPLFSPDFIVDCGRQPVLGLAIEPPLCSSRPSSRFLPSYSALRFASFGRGHLRLWSLMPKTKGENKASLHASARGSTSRRNRETDEEEYPPPSFRSCCFGPGFLSRESCASLTSRGVCTPSGSQSLASSDPPPFASNQGSRGFSAQQRSSLQSPPASSGASFLFPVFPSSCLRNPSQVPLVTAVAFLTESRELLAGTADGFVFIFRGLTAVRALSVSSPSSLSAVCLLLPFRKSLLLVATKNGSLTLLRTTGQPSGRLAVAAGSTCGTTRVLSARKLKSSSQKPETLSGRGNAHLLDSLRATAPASRHPTPRRNGAVAERERHLGLSLVSGERNGHATLANVRELHRGRIPREASRTSASAQLGRRRSACPKVTGRDFLGERERNRKPLASVGQRSINARRVCRAPFAERVLDRPVRTPRSSYRAAYSRPKGTGSRTALGILPGRRKRSLSLNVMERTGSRGRQSEPGERTKVEQGSSLHHGQNTSPAYSPSQTRYASSHDEDSSRFSFSESRPASCRSSACQREERKRWKEASHDGLRAGEPCPVEDHPGVSERPFCAAQRANQGERRVESGAKTPFSERVLHVRDILHFHACRNLAFLPPQPHQQTLAASPSQSLPPSFSSPSSLALPSPSAFAPSSSLPRASPWFPSQLTSLAGWFVPDGGVSSRGALSEPSLLLVTDSHILLVRLSPLLASSSLLLAQKPWGRVEASTSASVSAALPLSLYMEEAESGDVADREGQAARQGERGAARNSTRAERSWPFEADFEAARKGAREGGKWGDGFTGGAGRRRDGSLERTLSRERRTRIRFIKQREEIASRSGSILVTGGRCPVGGALHLWHVAGESHNLQSIGEETDAFRAERKHQSTSS
ncbi:conserved hypothetical protein [Neospora caninum Liverpool]|uniref:Uncharacterized protein n=1 Tax=Neospora caninum (strain Liverpool) TaxID=572307 RepID=F0VPV6_NEOCL|nr:conserved hypothetical protein [Neospora caninum Liverpool]CBZ55753.1 conserved hypothetical protein [Neospora caninum Liverpool]CEL70496.1 TPA: hypothetical protein BN1204_061780 [Neospora caninum Liverpool]|eukprot:XP_003885779.1 conserved hypothetical protein [Neospora caninum Liverpool]